MAFVVFGVTGSSSVAVIRPMFASMGFEGSMWEGPWSYRIGSVLAVSPVYACMLYTFGTLAGRHRFFGSMSNKIIGRMMPGSLSRKLMCTPAKESAAAKVTKNTAKAL